MKPNNLLISSSGELKLADFGLARPFGDATLAMTSQTVTRWYRAPELLYGSKYYTGAVDIWAMGCIFAELMLRTPYLPGESDLDQLNTTFRALGTPTEDEWPGMTQLPDFVEMKKYPKAQLNLLFTAASPNALDLLGRMLCYNPSKRITTYEALGHPYFADLPAPTRPENLPKITKPIAETEEEKELRKRKIAEDAIKKNLVKYNIETIDDITESSNDGKTTVYWVEYEDLPFEKILESERAGDSKIISCAYCIRKGLIRKVQVANNINYYNSKHKDSSLISGTPFTWIFELDDIDYLDEVLIDNYDLKMKLEENESKEVGVVEGQSNKERFIIKPSITNKGEGIHIFDSIEGLEQILENEFSMASDSEDEECEESEEEEESTTAQRQNQGGLLMAGNITSQLKEFVVQKYVDNPILLRKYGERKFHIRVYVLAMERMNVYVYREMLALFATNKYNTNDINDTHAHITNTCVQPDGVKQIENEAEGLVHRFWDLGPDAIDVEHVYRQIKDLTGDLFKAVLSQPTSFQPWENCFEVFGLDFLVDSNQRAIFLEANAYPDFKQTGSKFDYLIEGFFACVVKTLVSKVSKGSGDADIENLDQVL
ncbi:putative tubulin-tyrosine ligase [Zancudomyces culisetae]|uniref:Putative tubulin-tyrosine ligase n=1 Tax=Zancudomyces culisetae TaxID=1213189 RepID=A0A1R1PG34_ZANCU|nr:putative tubulin-tyrosine ligase [Zancudomyces culisetae]|eukprot:OMH79936.1 putative tubulin-tyrosine ligase [Zancudomyces culisetae]